MKRLAQLILLLVVIGVNWASFQTVTRHYPKHRPSPSPSVSPSPSPTGTATIAPSPSPSPSISLSPSPSTSASPSPSSSPTSTHEFGIAGQEILWHTAAQQDAQLNDMQSRNMNWLRVDLDWASVQGGGSTSFDWGGADALATKAKAHNVHLLFILNGTPAWARMSDCPRDNEFCRPDPAKFAVFARQAVARYAPMGVHDWEVWNEQNLSGSWLPSPNVSQYVDVLKAVYPAIKGADSTATVVSGGLAPLKVGAPSSEGIPTTNYVTSMYAAGAKSSFTALGFHPYGYPTPPYEYQTWNGFSILKDTTPSIRSIMTANSDSAKQVWLTEFGAPSNGPGPVSTCTNNNYDGSPDHVDECLQSKILSDGAKLVKTLPYAGPLFFYDYKDLGTSTSDRENFFGQIRYDGSHKPSYDAVKAQTLL